MSYKKLFGNIVFTICCVLWARSVEIRDCGSILEVLNVEIDGCDMRNDLSCPLYIGQSTNMKFQVYTGPVAVQSYLINDVSWQHIFGGPKFNLSVAPASPCVHLHCPLGMHYTGTYIGSVYVDIKYQPLSANLKWIIRTDDPWEEVLVCFQVPVTFNNQKNRIIRNF